MEAATAAISASRWSGPRRSRPSRLVRAAAGAAWTSDPQGRFRLHIADATKARRHQFGTGTADFHVCSTCGVSPIVTCAIEGRRYAIVNVNTFDDVDRSELVTSPADFEGETPENRLARRRRNWTPEADV